MCGQIKFISTQVPLVLLGEIQGQPAARAVEKRGPRQHAGGLRGILAYAVRLDSS